MPLTAREFRFDLFNTDPGFFRRLLQVYSYSTLTVLTGVKNPRLNFPAFFMNMNPRNNLIKARTIIA